MLVLRGDGKLVIKHSARVPGRRGSQEDHRQLGQVVEGSHGPEAGSTDDGSGFAPARRAPATVIPTRTRTHRGGRRPPAGVSHCSPAVLPGAIIRPLDSTRAKRSSPCGSASGITRSCWASRPLLTLPNLGGPSLWDVDEGVNAQAAREMREAGTWIVPTFNYQLRTAKPVMLYWLQRASYAAFGVSEWSARLPSVLAGWLAVLLTYELARRMFGRATGLLAGVVLVSVVQFGLLAHAATPDATLLLFTCLTFLAFWVGHADGSRRWWMPTAAACGLAVLTKGPIGVALPGLVILIYFAWNRELAGFSIAAFWARRSCSCSWPGRGTGWSRTRRAASGSRRSSAARTSSAFRARWTSTRGRSTTTSCAAGDVRPVERVLARGAVVRVRGTGRGESAIPIAGDSRPSLPRRVVHRLLVVFSAAATKLPNYIFPLYPALAILTARSSSPGAIAHSRAALGHGRGGAGRLHSWVRCRSAECCVADATFPGLGVWAVAGALPVAGAVVMARALCRDNRDSA